MSINQSLSTESTHALWSYLKTCQPIKPLATQTLTTEQSVFNAFYKIAQLENTLIYKHGTDKKIPIIPTESVDSTQLSMFYNDIQDFLNHYPSVEENISHASVFIHLEHPPTFNPSIGAWAVSGPRIDLLQHMEFKHLDNKAKRAFEKICIANYQQYPNGNDFIFCFSDRFMMFGKDCLINLPQGEFAPKE